MASGFGRGMVSAKTAIGRTQGVRGVGMAAWVRLNHWQLVRGAVGSDQPRGGRTCRWQRWMARRETTSSSACWRCAMTPGTGSSCAWATTR